MIFFLFSIVTAERKVNNQSTQQQAEATRDDARSP